MTTQITKTTLEECKGCCQRTTCDQDLEKCCYLVKDTCKLKNRGGELI